MAEAALDYPVDIDGVDDSYFDVEDEDLLGQSLDEFDAEFLERLRRDRVWAYNFYGPRNNEFDRMEKWYFKQHYAEGVESDEEIVDEEATELEHQTVIPILTNIINSVHGVLTDEEFYIQAISANGRRSEASGSKVERLCIGTYWINRQVTGEDAWETSAQDMLVYGWGCVYSYWDNYRAELAKRKGKETLDFYAYPLVVRRIHPRDIYPIPNGVRERYRAIFWSVFRTVAEIEDEWGVKLQGDVRLDDEGKVQYDENENVIYEELYDDTLVEYIDYWAWVKVDDDFSLYHCVMAADQVVKKPTEMVEYEMLPYEIYFCRKSVSDAGTKMGLSFMFPLIEPVQEMEMLANRLTAIIDQYADPMLKVIDPSNGDEQIEKGPGAIIRLNPGGDAGYIVYPGAPPEVNQMLRFWRETTQDAFPPVMTGMQGGTSGLDTIALQQGGKLQTNKPRKNLELAIERVNTKIIRLLQRNSWNEGIQVHGQRSENDETTPFAFNIKGKETRGFEHTAVTVRGRFPQEELRNAALAAQVSSSGLMSRRNAASKYLYVQDSESEFNAWMQEQLIMNPMWAQFYAQMYMALPTESPVSQALQEPAQGEEEGDGGGMLADLAGANFAAETATNSSQVQSAVQRTAVDSNEFSKIMGGVPAGR